MYRSVMIKNERVILIRIKLLLNICKKTITIIDELLFLFYCKTKVRKMS